MIVIYKITNRRNYKVYVGQTSRRLTQRFLEHICRDLIQDALDSKVQNA